MGALSVTPDGVTHLKNKLEKFSRPCFVRIHSHSSCPISNSCIDRRGGKISHLLCEYPLGPVLRCWRLDSPPRSTVVHRSTTHDRHFAHPEAKETEGHFVESRDSRHGGFSPTPTPKIPSETPSRLPESPPPVRSTRWAADVFGRPSSFSAHLCQESYLAL